MTNPKRHPSFLRGLLSALLALTLLLGCGASALAEAGTIFPWFQYTLDVALVTADPEVVNYRDAPKDAVTVLVKLVSVSGTIQMADIKEKCFDICLRDGDGDEFNASVWQVRGLELSEGGGFPTLKEEQDDFDLLFFLKGKDDSALAGAKLVVPTDKEGERVIVALDKAPHELPEEPDDQSEKE